MSLQFRLIHVKLQFIRYKIWIYSQVSQKYENLSSNLMLRVLLKFDNDYCYNPKLFNETFLQAVTMQMHFIEVVLVCKKLTFQLKFQSKLNVTTVEFQLQLVKTNFTSLKFLKVSANDQINI